MVQPLGSVEHGRQVVMLGKLVNVPGPQQLQDGRDALRRGGDDVQVPGTVAVPDEVVSMPLLLEAKCEHGRAEVDHDIALGTPLLGTIRHVEEVKGAVWRPLLQNALPVVVRRDVPHYDVVVPGGSTRNGRKGAGNGTTAGNIPPPPAPGSAPGLAASWAPTSRAKGSKGSTTAPGHVGGTFKDIRASRVDGGDIGGSEATGIVSCSVPSTCLATSSESAWNICHWLVKGSGRSGPPIGAV
eukprot:CAMPEP_0179024696 /NCGR_PEP_ID=MMETSP0796-20121207/7584_1 /TAXON_ID=73915 /ORGANISM="Pyrodinium bahamense, Strain pbaha01" /LENGTH=240 /DNA_ID=CAMNT_0020720657 /DNA_START=68 /DNA_END=788 /DNA_ORIENTATION=+